MNIPPISKQTIREIPSGYKELASYSDKKIGVIGPTKVNDIKVNYASGLKVPPGFRELSGFNFKYRSPLFPDNGKSRRKSRRKSVRKSRRKPRF